MLSEPMLNELNGSRIFSAERSQSMSILLKEPHRITHLETLEAKMANIEVSLSSGTNTPRRRKGTSLGGGSTASSRPSICIENISPQSNCKQEHRPALQERETIIQNIRSQFGLGKLLGPFGTPLDETEITAAEYELQKLRKDADNKRLAIRNLKVALENLDITDNIDIRIRQAELEYALGREELQLLSLVEEIRMLQSRIDKSLKTDVPNSELPIYSQLKNGVNLSLYAVNANLGRFGLNVKENCNGVHIDWVLEGEALFRGDRVIECNGKIVNCHSKEECQKLINSSGKCELVVIRKKTSHLNHQILLQSQEDNQRLQHRISYLEDQVKDLQQSTKDIITCSPQNSKNVSHIQNGKQQTNQKIIKGDHVTSINISSSPYDSEKPQVFQRGNFVATIIGGKAIKSSLHQIEEIIKNANSSQPNEIYKSIVANLENPSHFNESNYQKPHIYEPSGKLFTPASKVSISKEKYRDLKENYRRHRGPSDRHNSQPDLSYESAFKSDIKLIKSKQDSNENAAIVESRYRYKKCGNTDTRSAKSLDFEDERKSNILNISKQSTSTMCRKPRELDYTSEPVATPISSSSRARNGRPVPPKKPLRLSLQRTQSLQTIEANAAATIVDLEKKRAVKRAYRGNKQCIDSESALLYTASLGRK